MKVIIIAAVYPYQGGMAPYNYLLYKYLKKKHDVKVISFLRQYPKLIFPGKSQKDWNSNRTMNTHADFMIDTLNPLSWIKTFLKIKKEKPNLIIFSWLNIYFTFVYSFISILTRLFTKTKVCFICHNALNHEPLPGEKIFTKFTLSKANFITAASKEDKRTLKKFLPNIKIKVAYHPTYEIYDYGKLSKKQARKKLRLDQSKKILLFTGFVRKYKGLIYLIKAMPHILKKIKNAQLLIVGEFWDSKEKYIKEIKKLKLQNYVKIIDNYVTNEEFGQYTSASDIVVLPYVTATGSGIVQTAFGLKKPVIVTNVGSLPEVVDNGKTGFIVQSKNPKAIAKATIDYFKKNKEKTFIKNIIKENYRFSWDYYIKIIEELYNGCRNS